MRSQTSLALLGLSVQLILAADKGKLEEFSIESKAYGRARKVAVYTPPNYSPDRPQPYGVLICFDGSTYYEHEIPVPSILDRLTGADEIPPLVAILVDTSISRLEDLANNRRFVEFLGDEMLPWARKQWNITKDPRHTIVAGASAGGLGAAHAAFMRPDLFGNVLSQSGAFWRGSESSNSPPYEWLTTQYAASAKRPVRFYIEVGARETRHAVGTGPVFIEANRRFRDALLAKGYPVKYLEIPDGDHEPGHWGRQFPEGLTYLTSNWDRQLAAK